jgi:hypothetical protein
MAKTNAVNVVTPMSVGTVASLVGAPLRADVAFARDDERLAGYEIELVPGRKGGRSKAWSDPLWRVTSSEPHFVSLDGHHAFDGMLASRRRPRVRMTASQPIDAYSWVLSQDGDVVDKAMQVTDGISDDGLSFRFRSAKPLRRSGQPGQAGRTGVFYPPFDSHLPNMPRSEESRIRYAAMTHAGHDEQDAYAVDFNWGSGGADRGHRVLSAAAGRVSKVDTANGQVHIRHPKHDGDSDFETIYAHLDPILVKKGQRVRAQERIGRIGSTYHGDQAISPHLHHQHLRHGKPVKMKLLIHGKETPIGASRKRADRTVVWDARVPGWVRPRGPAAARLSVRARRAADERWSQQKPLRFVVAERKHGVPDEQDALFDAPPGTEAIAVDYNGPGVEPGEYTLRYRATGEAGSQTPWAYDESIMVEPSLA